MNWAKQNKIFGQCSYNVLRVYAVPFAAIDKLILALRQTAWSELNNFFLNKCERRKHAC